MRSLIVRLFLMVLPTMVKAQLPAEHELAYRRGCVRIERGSETRREVGSGHIMLRQGDSLLIATARHVVQDTTARAEPAPYGTVRLYNGTAELPYRVMHLDHHDLAFIKVREPSRLAPTPPLLRDAPIDVPVWVILPRKEYKTFPRGMDGQLLWRSGSGLFFGAAIPGIEGGDSGSLVITSQGLIGMVLRGGDEVQCLDIGYISDRLDQLLLKR